ncbi:MAG: NAD(P)H-dependent oxidoreductase, partial [Saprospiraceae bacterium]|nr:NAD(P)H-dependent oxidoreductase [Saprospiraceae bacterium]
MSRPKKDQTSLPDWDFSSLRALFLNCTLKPSPKLSHTDGLLKVSLEIMKKNGVHTEILRPVDYDIAPGVYPDMTEHGFEKDDWPAIQEKVMEADILVIGSPIWLGEKSSVCSRVIERLYGYSGHLNDEGQYAYYGRTAGCIITG